MRRQQHMLGRKGFFAAAIAGSLMLFASYGEGFANSPADAKDKSQLSVVSQIISDSHTGLALFGYDVVAYHTDAKSVEGRASHIAVHQNLIWRFVSEANRDAFQADPEAYLPVFGGHDARSVGEGRMTMGDPSFFLISKGSLLLFRSEENRNYFAAETGAYQNALKRWPEVMRHYAFH
jgi:hypothetical protein